MTGTLLRSSDDLPALAAMLEPKTDLTELAHYLRCRELGLRREMGSPLAAFARQAAAWSFEQRRALVCWIGDPWVSAAGYEPTSSFAKRGDPVFRAVVAPTLAEWRSREPEDATASLLACLWDEPLNGSEGGRTACLRAVLERSPSFLPARRALIRAVLDQIGFSQHEWPHGYLGDPAGDIRLLSEAAEMLQRTPDDEWRQRMERATQEMRELADEAVGRRSGQRSTTDGWR